MDPMGEGSSAAAIIVYHRESLRTFAIRTINLEKFNNELNDIKNELQILKTTTQKPHRNLVKLIQSKMYVSSKTKINKDGINDI